MDSEQLTVTGDSTTEKYERPGIERTCISG